MSAVEYALYNICEVIQVESLSQTKREIILCYLAGLVLDGIHDSNIHIECEEIFEMYKDRIENWENGN
jgi:hypothetical protein